MVHEANRSSRTRDDATPTGRLALAPDSFRQLGYRAVDLAAEYLAHIPDSPVFASMTNESREEIISAQLTETGDNALAILEEGAKQIFANPMGNGHPRFFGWVNSPPAPLGALADFLASASGPSCAGGDHAAIYLEHACVRWLKEMIGFPAEGSGGLLVSGGSMASLTCLAAAREWASARDGWSAREDGVWISPSRLMLYVSTETHTTIRKAAHLLGLGEQSVNVVRAGTDQRMDLDALKDAIRADRSAGKRPFCVIASAGTAATGAVDPLDSIADICQEEGLWLHVDGAYGGVGIVDPAVAELFTGLERADSIAIDPHKWLSVPVECGCVLVRDESILRQTFSLVPSYIDAVEGKGFGGPPWFSEFGFQQTRGFRALKLWMVLRQFGRAGLREHIANCNRLARELARLVSTSAELELCADLSLSIVCFRFRPSNWMGTDDDLSRLNRRIMEEIQTGGEAFITNAVIDGCFVLRACVLHYATTQGDIEALVDIVRDTGERLRSNYQQENRNPATPI